MGKKWLKEKKTKSFLPHNICFTSEEDVEDMKKPYWIKGKLIYALNEEIAKEIYNRNFLKLEE